ncbi:MAG: transposase [Alphaproteobacteria bacterium]
MASPFCERLSLTINVRFCGFDLPAERFSFIELTDEKGGERLDRTPVAEGDIVIADRGFLHPEPLTHVLQQGADVIIRAGWKGARWLDAKGERFDIQAALQEAETVGLLDQSVCIGRKKGPALSLRLVAFRLPPIKAEEARARARRAAKREDYAVSGGTLAAAGWVILVTSLDAGAFPAAKISELYRVRHAGRMLSA